MIDEIVREDLENIRERLSHDFKNERVLVTGGAGFLGSWICDVLVEEGAAVVCLDNLASGLKSNIDHLLGRKNFEFLQHDVTEPIPMRKDFDLVIHMASRASPFEFERFPIEILKANTVGTLNALEIAMRSGARFLFASSSEIYGDPEVVPTPESYNGNVDPVGPRSCYEESKRAGEALVAAYKSQYGLDARIARIFNTYGPRMRADGIYGRVVPRFIKQALNNEPLTVFGNGFQTRSFIYVSDQIEGLLRFASSEEAKGEIINLGNDVEMRIMDLAKLIKRLLGSKSEISLNPLPAGDPRRRCPDITKAKKILKWEPRISIEEGLRRTCKWFSK